MLELIDSHVEKMLTLYTQGEYFERLKQAKEAYVSLTGKLDEDKDEFESRMNCFNEWYLFQWKDESGKKIVEDYIRRERLDEDLSQAFLNVNHTLLEFTKVSWRDQFILKDILHDEKIALAKNHKHIGLVEDDIFIGRVIRHKGENYLLRGVCTLPQTIRKQLKKQSKKVHKLNSFEEELKYLLQLESLKTKSMHYRHIEPSKIFVFN
jgi:DNA-binding ferritin-like protein (Dps family)